MAPDDQTTKTRQRARITISSDGMSATLILTAPLDQESPISFDEVMEEIEKAGLVYGVDEDKVRNCVETMNYNNPTVVATGLTPRKGENATFEHHFDTTWSAKPQEDDDGRIDYKNISYIQNTEKGTVLVTKTPPTEGVPGRTVRGKELKAPAGADIPFKAGKNTEISADGLQLLASASGAIMHKFGTTAVNDLTIISSDVDHSTGNIDCRGSVRVTGNIKAGFSLKIDGDLEVYGHVEDCEILVGGNVMVRGGFFGKGDGVMKAGGNVSVKYAEGQKIVAGGSVTLEGEAVNCDILCRETITVKDRKGKIVGGEVKAGREIKAASLGANTGTVTKLYVAFNPKLMNRYNEIKKEDERLQSDAERVKEGLYGLYRLQMNGKLTASQEEALAKLQKFQKDLPASLENLEKEKEEIEEKLKKYQDARIIATDCLYAGVTAYFGIVYKEILEDHETCQLMIENSKILLSKFSDS